jgi:hypothetical protein
MQKLGWADFFKQIFTDSIFLSYILSDKNPIDIIDHKQTFVEST